MSITGTSNVAAALLLGPLLLGCLQAPASAPTLASSERSVDLGPLAADRAPTHTFRITNPSPRAIRIGSVEKSCGCQTVGVREGDTIPPGGSLDVSYALPADRPGPVGGLLTLRTDADSPELATIRLSLSATLPRRVWSEPGALRLGRDAAATLKVRSDLPGILETFRDCGTVRGHVIVEEVERVPGADGAIGGIVLTVRLAPEAPAGLVSDYLAVRFDDSRVPQLDVLVQGEAVGSAPSPETAR